MQICAAAANSRCLFPLPKGFRIQSSEGNVNGENIPEPEFSQYGDDFPPFSCFILVRNGSLLCLFVWVFILIIWAYFTIKRRVIEVIKSLFQCVFCFRSERQSISTGVTP